MSIQIDHGHTLHQPILMLGGVVLLVILFVGSAYQYNQQQKAAWQQVVNAYRAAQQKEQLAQQKQTERLQYLPQYQHWIAVGFIGEERRQQWLERLRQVREQYDLFNIDYDIGKQQVYQPGFIKKIEYQGLYRSVMTLKLGLLHEGDLLHLLAGLRQNTSPFIVRECEVLRVADTQIKLNTLHENLKAQCEIDWLTFKEMAPKEPF